MTCRRTNICVRTVSSICSIFSGFLLGPIIFGYEGPAAAAKSHIIYWNTSNPLFRANSPKELVAFVSDVLIFVCPNRVLPTNKVFWTSDSRAYTYCQIPQETAPMQLLVDCFTKPPAYKLFLNLSHLMPQISRSKSQRLCHIYFIADEILCNYKNMHINVTVIFPYKHSMPEGETREMADSASDVRGNKITKSMKPLQPEADPTAKPRNQRFIGLLIAYVLITLLVVYMVVCAVCFQPRNCKPCFCRKPTSLSSSSNQSSRAAYCITHASPTSQPDARLRLLARSSGHFSRSIGSGERFLQETSSLELLAPHALAARNDCGHPSPLAAWQARRGLPQSALRPAEPPPPLDVADRHGASQKGFEKASAVPSSSKLVGRVENRQTPVIFTKVAC
ncbi:hypothetical protein AAHC03_010177 [Spirometra sp. Aus1]